MIRWLHVKNFRSLRDTRVEFTSPLMAVIGANNTGKTSLLLALDILRQLANHSPSDVFRDLLNPEFVQTQGSSGPVEFALCFDSPALDHNPSAGRLEYHLALAFTLGTGGIQVERELLEHIDGGGRRRRLLSLSPGQKWWTYLDEASGKEEEYHGSVNQHALFLLTDMRKHPKIIGCRAALSNIRLYGLQPKAMKTAAQILPMPILESDGGNLPAVLDSFRGEFPDRFAAVENDISRIMPEVDSVLLKTTPAGSKFVAFHEKWLPRPVFSFQASDGILRSAAMLTAVNAPQEPLLIAFEEPENGLHPRRLVDIVESFRLYAQTKTEDGCQRQVIITTHSPYVLNKLQPEEMLVASRDESGTQIKPIKDIEKVNRLLEGAPLGALWFRGSLGGVPSP